MKGCGCTQLDSGSPERTRSVRKLGHPVFSWLALLTAVRPLRADPESLRGIASCPLLFTLLRAGVGLAPR
jgi:hypothetical protein